MNLDQIETKCFILALFIRDDGERFLLGSRAYEFVDSQLHFVANSYQNDIVEVQGNDGVMLAGQVRRGTSQPFDGYIGDQTVDRSTIEQYRRDFMKFFRKNHYYKVVYVFPDGSAVQRRNGFIVEAPEVKELYQLFPKYHISMNFEDINYYNYEEDSEGEEIYGESATLKISMAATGGLIWEEDTESEISGEGSQFTLQDTIDGNVLDSVQLKGDTTQQTYSGKNLFSPSVHFTSKDNVGVTNTSSTIDVSGGGYATYTIPTEFSTNDSVTLSGIATPKVQNQYRILYRYSDDGSSWTGYLTLASGSPGVNVSANFSGTVTGHKYYRLVFYAKGYTETGNGEVKYEQIQFEKGSVTPYEPYTGGIPAPNPSYPQTVNTVTGRQVVEVYGKNLLNLTTFVKGRVDSGVIGYESGTSSLSVSGNDISFTTTADNRGIVSEMIEVTPSTEYTFSGTSTTVDYRYVDYYDNTGTWLSRATGGSSFSNITFTTPSNCYGVRISFRRSTSGTGTISNAQLEKGSFATAYQPHYSYEVNLGKNLYNINNTLENRYLASGGVWANDANTTYNNFEVNVQPSSSLTVSFTERVSAAIRVGEYAGDGTYITRTVIANTNSATSPQTITVQDNTMKVVFSIEQSESKYYTNLQIELGSTATSYAPYFTPIELCKIGDYQDYIYKSDDEWYVHKEINKRILDGTEANWGITSRTNGYQFSVNNAGQKIGINSKTEYFCNNFEGIPFSQRDTHSESIYTYSGDTVIRILTNVASSVADFKTWLGSHNTNVYYILASPTDIQITDSSLIAQLNALAGATTYDGQTVFTVTSANQLAILDVTVIARTGGGVVWDNYGAEWEEGTGGGPTMVNVDSIDNVYPVLTLTGPAVNPQISVLTTNTTLSYSGTVTASQELKIDMFNKTATLNGASVVGNVSGDWVYLKPGVNRITYTTNNADAPDSTIWWQEIVG